MGKERITVQVGSTQDNVPAEVEIFLNKEGLDLFVAELQALSKKNDHFHLGAEEWGDAHGHLSLKPYNEGEVAVGHVKVSFRPDDWDREHFPHLFRESGSGASGRGVG